MEKKTKKDLEFELKAKNVSEQIAVILKDNNFSLSPELSISQHGVVPVVRLIPIEVSLAGKEKVSEPVVPEMEDLEPVTDEEIKEEIKEEKE